MTTKVEMFRSVAGNVFDTEHQALRDDLCELLTAPGHVTAPIATKIIGALCGSIEDASKLSELVNRLYLTRPQMPEKRDEVITVYPDLNVNSTDVAAAVGKYTNSHMCDYQPRQGEQIARCTICNAPAFDARRPPTGIGAAIMNEVRAIERRVIATTMQSIERNGV